MKRYLIEPESVSSSAPASETSTATGTAATSSKVIYRIIDILTQQPVSADSDDIDAVTRACAELNAADEQGRVQGYGASELPDDIVQAIAISNAKSIEEQPAILANLALAQQIFNQNMRQQIALSHQQAMNQIKLAVVAKCVAMIDGAGSTDSATVDKVGSDIEKMVRKMEHLLDGKGGNGLSP